MAQETLGRLESVLFQAMGHNNDLIFKRQFNRHFPGKGYMDMDFNPTHEIELYSGKSNPYVFLARRNLFVDSNNPNKNRGIYLMVNERENHQVIRSTRDLDKVISKNRYSEILIFDFLYKGDRKIRVTYTPMIDVIDISEGSLNDDEDEDAVWKEMVKLNGRSLIQDKEIFTKTLMVYFLAIASQYKKKECGCTEALALTRKIQRGAIR